LTTVSDIMTRTVRSLSPTDSLTQAAQLMDELNVGVVPVCTGDTVVGIVTDRDIILRGVARGLDGASSKLSDVMTGDVQSCYEDQDLSQVMVKMGDAQIRRLPVLDRKDRLVGILSLGDVAVRTDDKRVASVLQNISEPAGQAASATPG
jgi:CBS domain-containing protein